MPSFDLPGALRRIRRTADLSQRELAVRLHLSKSAIAAVETGHRGLEVGALDRAAGIAGYRLVLLDGDSREVTGMSDAAVRDGAGRRFPAHLDTRYGDRDWWHGDERYSRAQPWYTYDRVREWRDVRRDVLGTPADHQLPRPGDSPRDRRLAWQQAAHERREQERRRRVAAGERVTPGWTCTCPTGCDAAREDLREVHVEDCPCRCDIA